jgi:hypothetical protein
MTEAAWEAEVERFLKKGTLERRDFWVCGGWRPW